MEKREQSWSSVAAGFGARFGGGEWWRARGVVSKAIVVVVWVVSGGVFWLCLLENGGNRGLRAGCLPEK